MKKYWALIKHTILRSAEYRAEAITWIALSIFPNLILFLVWKSAYGDVSTVNGYSLSEVLQYFLFGFLINAVTATHFETWRAHEVRDGRIDHYVMKPLSYPVQIFLFDLGSKIFYLALAIPGFFISYFLLSFVLPLEGISVSASSLLQFILLLGFGYIIEYSIGMATVLSVFWFEGADGLQHFKWIIVTVFSGWMIPIAFMPEWLATLVRALPLKYMYAVPIEILQQKYTLGISDVIYIGITLGSTVLALRFFWQIAIRKYTSAGG